MSDSDVMPKARKARMVSLAEQTVRAPKPNLGMLTYGKGRMIQGHKHDGVPPHVMKAVEARRKMTLTGTRC